MQGSLPTPSLDLDHVHASFLAALPRIVRHAQVYFRFIKCPHRKEEMIAETVALAWSWWIRLLQRDKDPSGFISALATHAVRHVRMGRRLCGQEKTKDVVSPSAQWRRNFTVQSLPQFDTGTEDNKTLELLRDDSRTPPGEQAAFRIDFPRWLTQLGQRNRLIAEDMAMGENTQDLAAKHNVTQGRVSQLRREFYFDWHRFHGEEVLA